MHHKCPREYPPEPASPKRSQKWPPKQTKKRQTTRIRIYAFAKHAELILLILQMELYSEGIRMAKDEIFSYDNLKQQFL